LRVLGVHGRLRFDGSIAEIPLTDKAARNCPVKRSILSGERTPRRILDRTHLDKIGNLGQISELFVMPIDSMYEPSVKSPRGEDL
jgi:hypothetical protein